ncbi:alpha-amylase B-like [Topomyia yanbarensis]|uniref:alpha-amylase B-like n=1 Tax=Topomyia yanbarensis TaxID=2498891 RepID=UPI00273B04A9|nr:alpha-amylase B-like [Topomyia yanbarensis]
MHVSFLLVLLCCTGVFINAQIDPNQWPNRSGIVQLFEWKWTDIAAECERFLAAKGYGGVQISPPAENTVMMAPFRPWWERYQPISYYLNSRSGTEAEFVEMVRRCNVVGVRIYADVVLNHMSSFTQYGGTGGSTADSVRLSYPAVPYNMSDFNENCLITESSNPIERRSCRLEGSPDLNQRSEWVRDRIVNFLNKLITYGVAGFTIDAAKYMWAEDLQIIYGRLSNLSEEHGFEPGSRPFIIQSVVDMGEDGISKYEYRPHGMVTELGHSHALGYYFSGQKRLSDLKHWGRNWSFLASERAIVFVDDHLTQRNLGSKKGHVLTFKDKKHYIMASAFMLAFPYGTPRVMSSYEFGNIDQGPPADAFGNVISPSIGVDGTCQNGWICEHRWNGVANMIGFRNAVIGTELTNWFDNGGYQIGFCRGNRGFIAFNLEGTDLNRTIQTCLPMGRYCDVISGTVDSGVCTGAVVDVGSDGTASVYISAFRGSGALAIHVNSKI